MASSPASEFRRSRTRCDSSQGNDTYCYVTISLPVVARSAGRACAQSALRTSLVLTRNSDAVLNERQELTRQLSVGRIGKTACRVKEPAQLVEIGRDSTDSLTTRRGRSSMPIMTKRKKRRRVRPHPAQSHPRALNSRRPSPRLFTRSLSGHSASLP
jgi:hypothetical protein